MTRRKREAYASNFLAGGPGGGGIVLGTSPRDWVMIPCDPQVVQNVSSAGPGGNVSTYFQEFIFRETMTFSQMTVFNTLTPGAGTTLAFGIYALDSNGKLKTLLAEAVYTLGAAPGNALTAPVTQGTVVIPPGLYALAMAASAAGTGCYGPAIVAQVFSAWNKNHTYAGFISNGGLVGGHLQPDCSTGVYTAAAITVPFILLEP